MRKLKVPRPLRRFYLYPDGGWIHFRVFIWKTQHDMWLALPDKGANFAAISCGGERYVKRKKRWQFRGEIGQLHFYHDSARTGIITHECCHAAHTYFRFRKWFAPIVVKDDSPYRPGRKWVTNREEVFCWVMGNLVREFIVRREKLCCQPKAMPNWFNPVKFRVYTKPLGWDGQ